MRLFKHKNKNYTFFGFPKNKLKGQSNIIEICKRLNADQYINPSGGRTLYTAHEFSKEGIKLSFLDVKHENIKYKQYGMEFVPCLSIIDILMFNSIQEVRRMLTEYKIECKEEVSEMFIQQDTKVYNEENIYTFDNRIMLHYYSERILEIIGGEGKSILECGIGHGYSTNVFSERFSRHLVLEADEVLIKNYYMNNPDSKAEIKKVYFEDFDTDEKFDVIVLGFVLEHVENPQFIFNKYKKFLSAQSKAIGGGIFVTVPNAEALNRRIGQSAGLIKNMEELSDKDLIRT